MTLKQPVADKDVISRIDTFVATSLDGEVIMMSMETGQYIHLDDIATDVWSRVETPASFAEVVSTLCDLYDVGQEQCREQTAALVGRLADLGVLAIART